MADRHGTPDGARPRLIGAIPPAVEDAPRRDTRLLFSDPVPAPERALWRTIDDLAGRDGWQDALAKLGIWWVATRCIGAGVGALAARAHPVTVLVTVLLAPVAFFIAVFGPRLWMFAALTELRFRKPRVADFENVAADTADWATLRSSLFRNRVLHLFLVVMLVTLGLTVGNLVMANVVLRFLSGAA